jgi:hypothetical protein
MMHSRAGGHSNTFGLRGAFHNHGGVVAKTRYHFHFWGFMAKSPKCPYVGFVGSVWSWPKTSITSTTSKECKISM